MISNPPPSAFHQRLVFDADNGAILDQTRRYMLLRPDALMGIFRKLPEPAKRQALEALKASIFEQGSDSAKAYRAMGSGSAAELLETIAATAPQLGWGRWQFSAGDGAITLNVENSPFAAGHGASPYPVCHAIAGMLEAVSGMVLGKRTSAQELECAAMGAPCCRFEARPLGLA